jgi:hypothetical protein
MKRAIRVTITTLLALAATAGFASSVTTGQPIDTTPQLIAQNGFGDPANSYAWSMAWFNGKLYVGTAKHEICVENETVDYYLVVSGRYTTNPQPGVHCPSDPYAMDLRAEIWQYTPSTSKWQMVYQSPTEPNPRAPGRQIARDIAYRGMVVSGGRLYVGDVTADEYIPELAKNYPPRMLSTTDGTHFTSIPATGVIEHSVHGFGRPMGLRAMQVWNNHLFVTLTPRLTGDGAVFEVLNPDSANPRFRQVSPSNLAVFEMQVFNNSLYLGTGNTTQGYGVYRMSEVPGTSSFHVKPVVTNGAGRGATITSVVSMHTFRNDLYVGSAGWYNPHYQPLSELIRIDSNDQWSVVAGATRIADGKTRAPVSGLGDGFYSAFAAHFWRMETFNGALYVGTNDWSWLLAKAYPNLQPSYLPGILQTLFTPDFGFDLWASCDGNDWFPVTKDAFGNPYDFGARNLVASPDGLFVGSANQSQGTKIWDIPTSPCQTLNESVRLARAGVRDAQVASPDGLVTDSQRDGTVVSWNAAAGASKYEVLRSSDLDVSLDLAKPDVVPGNFTLDNQVPNIVSPRAPGATPLTLPVPQNFVPVATTNATYYVDRTVPRGNHYLYRIVAIGSGGHASTPSSVAAAPDPRPAPTLVQLLQAIGPHSVLGASVSADVARADPGATMRLLARLQRRFGVGTVTGSLIERLKRRIQYAGVAGGH